MSAGLARDRTAAALAAACVGLALYAVMDGLMKALALTVGAYSALFWRVLIGLLATAGLYAASRARLPTRRVVGVHLVRSAIVAVMGVTFFWGIARVPMAEAIGLSFIAPLIALALAALLLKERVGLRAVLGSLLGLAGVGVMLAGRIGGESRDGALLGAGAVLLSAVFYAVNLVLARHQAQLARPLEIAFFQNLFVLLFLTVPAPALLVVPGTTALPLVLGAALLATASLLLLSWAYARAEAQALFSVEYSAFIWSALTGWWMFGEALTPAVVAGTVLIVAGCVLAVRRANPSEFEAAIA